MADEAVLVDRASRKFGATVAVDDVSFHVARGEMFGLIGPDGAGKTTTIRLLCGLLKADSGRLRVLGHDPVREHAALTREVGYFSQRFSLYGDLSIDENIAFFAEIHGLRDYEGRRTRLLDMTQLTPFRHRLAEQLSGGMKQKLALACTLVHEPRLILLDEPTTGVDPVSRREFWKLLSEFLSQGITILMATPYLDEAERCARVGLFSNGRLLAAETPAALKASLPGVITEIIAVPQERAAAALERAEGYVELQHFGERLHVRWQDEDPNVAVRRAREALATDAIDSSVIRPVPASLEDVFINRVTRAPASITPPASPGGQPQSPRLS